MDKASSLPDRGNRHFPSPHLIVPGDGKPHPEPKRTRASHGLHFKSQLRRVRFLPDPGAPFPSGEVATRGDISDSALVLCAIANRDFDHGKQGDDRKDLQLLKNPSSDLESIPFETKPYHVLRVVPPRDPAVRCGFEKFLWIGTVDTTRHCIAKIQLPALCCLPDFPRQGRSFPSIVARSSGRVHSRKCTLTFTLE